jgi:hypothetical protein
MPLLMCSSPLSALRASAAARVQDGDVSGANVQELPLRDADVDGLAEGQQ